MNKTPPHFTPKALVLALRKALPFCFVAGLGVAVVSPAVGQSGDASVLFTTTQLIRQFTLKNTVAQVTQGMQGSVVTVNGALRSAAMGSTLPVFPTDMGTVPSSSNLPQLDGAGRPLGYCAWDNTAGSSNTSFLAGQAVASGSRLVYAVVSSGLDGVMSTSCADVLTNRRGQGDDFVQFSTPSSGGTSQLIASVGTEAELGTTTGVLGDIRLARDTNKLYSHNGTSWNALTANSDPSAAVSGTSATFSGNVTADTGTFNTITVGGGGAGTITATGFIGNGSGLTDLNAGNISSGVLSTARGGTGLDTSAAAQGTLLIGNGGGFSLGSLSAGNGIGIVNGAGSITISNTGVLSIAGTANQVVASANTGNIVLSLPQDIATNSMPTFGGMMLNGNLTGTTATFGGAVTVDSLSALRLNVGTSAGGVTNQNLIIGNTAMPGAQTGLGGNTAVGINALNANTSGDNNTAVGYIALQVNTTGLGNVAVGTNTLRLNTSGSSNTATGVNALSRNTIGNNNVASGRNTLDQNTTGSRNVSIGAQAGQANTTGSDNTFLGHDAEATSSALNFATAIGSGSFVATSNTMALGRNSALDQIVIGTDSRNDTFAGTKLYVNGVTNLNGNLRGTTATFTGALTANSFIGDGSGLTNIDISNFSGILPVAQGGTGLDGSTAANGSLLIGNGTGYTLGTLTGTANQVNVTNGAGTITLSLPQNIATTSTPTFGGLTLNGAITGTTGTFTGAVTVDSLSALRLNVGTSAGGVTSPNVIIGNDAMPGAQSGTGGNTAVGISALRDNTSGNVNTAIGRTALQRNTTGIGNVAVGVNALWFNTTGTDNVATGVNTLANNTIGNNNVASGRNAMDANTTGSSNVSIGNSSGRANTTGSNNTFLGASADATSNALNFAAAIGAGSTVATSNTLALGRNSATDQIVIGTATRNDTFAGTKLYVNGVTNLNGDLRGTTATFTGALTGTTGTFTGAVTVDSLTAQRLNITTSAGVTGANLIIGSTAMAGAQSGDGFNTAVGISALKDNTTGNRNTAVGNVALSYNTTGSSNTATGFGALFRNTTGSENTANGSYALHNNTEGSFNTATGSYAMADNTTGGNNTAFGRNALGNNTTGSNNVALGRNTGAINTTGSDNTFLGYGADATTGALTFATAIGSTSRVATSNTLALGRNSALDQIVIGTDTRNDTFAGTKLYVNGVTNLNGDLRGTTATFTGALTANSFVGDGSGLTNLDVSDFSTGTLAVARGGTGLSATPTNGQLLIGNGTGYTLGTLTGTANQVNVTNGAGTITLSLPQNIATTSTPTFGGLTLNGAITGTTGTFTGAVTVDSLSALRLNVGTSAGGVTFPNLIIGNGAMPGAQTGTGNNTAVGINALNANTSGNGNTAVGRIALQLNTTGSENAAFGVNTLRLNTTGNNNTGIGTSALRLNSTGSNNTAVGRNAQDSNTTGGRNVSIGAEAGFANTTGNDNTFLGYAADATTGALTFATAIGSGSRVATSATMALGRNSALDQVVIGTDTRNDTFAGTKLYVNGVTNMNGDLRGTTATFSGAVTLGSLAAQRLDVGTSAGPVTNPNLIIGNSAMPGAQTGAGANTAVGISALNANTSGQDNTGVGYRALIVNTTGQGNTALGANALNLNTTGVSNTAIGTYALQSNTIGNNNIALGRDTLALNTTGYRNIAIGLGAGTANTTGNDNTFLGNDADATSNALSYATAIGSDSRVATSNTLALGRNSALDQIVIGTATRNDTFAGTKLYVNGVTNMNGDLRGTTGTFTGAVTVDSLAALRLNVGTSTGVTNPNLIVGNGAMPGAQTGNGNNVAVGIDALYLNTSGERNTAIGNATLYSNTTASNNTANGFAALFSNTTGVGNVAIGNVALYGNTTGNNNVAIGNGAGYSTLGGVATNANTTGGANTFLGSNAMPGTTTPLFNATALGAEATVSTTNTLALGRNSTLDQVVIGTDSRNDTIANTKLYVNGPTNLNGSLNGTTATFTGAVTVDSLSALRLNVGTSAGSVTNPNLIVGNGAMPGAQTGAGANTAVGINALGANTSGNTNAAFGSGAMRFNTSGYANAAMGAQALRLNTTGYSNTATGIAALEANTTGFENTANGRDALIANTTGQRNTALGTFAGNTNTTGSDNLFLGYDADATSTGLSFASAIGPGSTVATSNTMALGRNSATDQIVIGTATRNDTFAGTKLYVNGVTNLNGDLRGTTANFSGRVDAATLFVNGVEVTGGGGGSVNKAAIDTALTIASSIGVTRPENNLALGLNALDNQAGAGNVAIGQNVLTNINSLASTQGIFNTGVGYNALSASTTGSQNVALGANALTATTTGTDNTAVGTYALQANITGRNNTAVGTSALTNATTQDNTAVGAFAMQENTTGAQNTALGYLALNKNVSGGNNTAVGVRALRDNTGSSNTAIGWQALLVNTGGANNIAVGNSALVANTSGARNTALGMNSLAAVTVNPDNVAVGYNALTLSTGARNTALGTNAGDINTTGGDNTFLGFGADATVNNLSFAAAIGSGSTVATSNTIALGRNSTADQVVIGAASRNDTIANTKLYVNGPTNLNGDLRGTTATFTGAVTVDSLSALRLNIGTSAGPVTNANLIIGNGAIPNAQTGTGGNTAVGINAMAANTSGNQNSALGLSALTANTTGINNSAFGSGALAANTTTNNNSAFGRSALAVNTAAANSAFGASALVANTTGTRNVGLGNSALPSNTSGSDNVGIGFFSLRFNTSGIGGSGLGAGALQTNTIGTYNTAVGYDADVTVNNLNFASAIGGFARVSTSDTVVIGALTADKLGGTTNDQVVIGGKSRTGTYNLYVDGTVAHRGITNLSDRRIKSNIQQISADEVLSRFENLNVYNYYYSDRQNLGRQIGVIAQEVLGLYPDLVNTDDPNLYSVHYDKIGVMAAAGVGRLNVRFKELDTKVEEQGTKLLALEDVTGQHSTKIAALESWKTDAINRMDTMQGAIDLNIQKIADHAVAIQTNTEAIERLDDALITLDDKVKGNARGIDLINQRWARNFSESADGSLLTVNAVELKVSNFTAQNLRAESAYTQRLEAEMARITELEVNNLRANQASANVVRAEEVRAKEVNTGSGLVYAGVGSPAFLFAAPADGHYTVATSSMDGSHATAMVIVNAGQALVVSIAKNGIELIAEGNVVKAIAAGKSIRASWTKVG